MTRYAPEAKCQYCDKTYPKYKSDQIFCSTDCRILNSHKTERAKRLRKGPLEQQVLDIIQELKERMDRLENMTGDKIVGKDLFA